MMTSYDVSGGQEVPKFALTQFSVEQFFGFWPQLSADLDKVPHTWKHWTKESICSEIAGGLTQIWGIGHPPQATLILFTAIKIHPALKVLSITWALGGLEDDMIPLLEATFMNFAQLNECDEVEVHGRPGWEAKLKPLGFRKDAVVLSRRVPKLNIN
jgi:hypothetical protein